MIVDCRAGPQKNVQQHVASDGKSNTKLWMICLKMFLYTDNILTGMPAEVLITNSGGYSVWERGGGMKLRILILLKGGLLSLSE